MKDHGLNCSSPEVAESVGPTSPVQLLRWERETVTNRIAYDERRYRSEIEARGAVIAKLERCVSEQHRYLAELDAAIAKIEAVP